MISSLRNNAVESSRSQGVQQVIIIGAGLAGLSCARVLHQYGIGFTILEKSDRPGGRIKTDSVDGYLLDHGFQVLQTGYPGLTDHLDLDRLRISKFPAGVAVHHDHRFHVVADPRQHLKSIFSTMASPIGSLADRFRLLRLVGSLVRSPMEKIFADPEQQTIDFLREQGFSERFIHSFFAPFFAGACLDTSMTGSSRVLKYVTRLFATGDAALPADGMGAIPQQISAFLPEHTIRYNQEVVKVEEGAVSLADGSVLEASHIVVAVSQKVCARLLQLDDEVTSVGEACVYFSTDWRPPLSEPFLVLNGEGSGPINNIAFPSLVAPHYAPPGETLVAAVVLGDQYLRSDDLEDQVRRQCKDWFGVEAERWKHIKTYKITHALPSQKPPTSNPYQNQEPFSAGIRICGEHGSLPGLQWALMSGEMTGRSLIDSMGEHSR